MVDEVLREVERKDDGLVEWLKERQSMIVPIDEALQRHVMEIMGKYSRLVEQ